MVMIFMINFEAGSDLEDCDGWEFQKDLAGLLMIWGVATSTYFLIEIITGSNP